jgi:hypothetical protein
LLLVGADVAWPDAGAESVSRATQAQDILMAELGIMGRRGRAGTE